jgi:hypothetical protein
MKRVKKALKGDLADFEVGTIITWTRVVEKEPFPYAAIRTPRAWLTTAPNDLIVKRVYSFDNLLEVLSREGIADVRVIGRDDGTKVEP